MKWKAMNPLAFAAAAAAMFVTCMPLRTSETDDRIESSFLRYLSDWGHASLLGIFLARGRQSGQA